MREAVDRLLPVASLGGLVLGVRLLVWRGIGTIPATASVIVEVLLNVFALYIFGTLATLILLSNGGSHREVVMGLVLSLPIAIVPLLLLRYGSVFQRLQRFLKPLTGLAGAEAATALDADLHFCVGQIRILSLASTMQFLALVSGSFEIWWALRLFDHPVSATSAIMLEGLMQAARHLAFIVPAGPGRAGSGAGGARPHAWDHAPNWRLPFRSSSECARSSAACRRFCPGTGSRRAGCARSRSIARPCPSCPKLKPPAAVLSHTWRAKPSCASLSTIIACAGPSMRGCRRYSPGQRG